MPAVAGIVAGFEIFDKTAAVSMHHAATTGERLETFLSAMVGLILANILGVLFIGALIAKVMTAQDIELASGIVFIAIGTYLVIGGKEKILGWFGIETDED